MEAIILKKGGTNAPELLAGLFQSPLVVNVEGQPTRRRASKGSFPDDLQPIVDRLIKERLLSTEGQGETSTVSVAHEKLFDAWPALAHWIAENREDLLVLRRAELEAREWERHAYDPRYLWHADHLKRLQEIVQRLGNRDYDSILKEFAAPQDKLLKLLQGPSLTPKERQDIGAYLVALGDPRPGVGLRADGIPDIDWVDIPGGKVKLDEVRGEFNVKPFQIARYPVTNIQFRAFVEAKDGYGNSKWWKDLEQSEPPESPRWSEANHPRETVSWYEAVAFCRWLTQGYRNRSLLALGQEIRLPDEWEWQQAATRGCADNVYPWGPDWDSTRCNSDESGLNRTVAVGLYPHGARPEMAGNVWEWCRNKYENPKHAGATEIDPTGDSRVTRGGSWNLIPGHMRSSYRVRSYPVYRSINIGFRLAQDRG